MRKFISLFLVLTMTFILLSASFAFAGKNEWIMYNGSSNKKSLNVREDPSTDSKKIGSIAYGEPVSVRDRRLREIRFADAAGGKGNPGIAAGSSLTGSFSMSLYIFAQYSAFCSSLGTPAP